eukprot:Lankesteria_metandrocarpae@DN1820_c0_g1_i1.p1
MTIHSLGVTTEGDCSSEVRVWVLNKYRKDCNDFHGGVYVKAVTLAATHSNSRPEDSNENLNYSNESTQRVSVVQKGNGAAPLNWQSSIRSATGRVHCSMSLLESSDCTANCEQRGCASDVDVDQQSQDMMTTVSADASDILPRDEVFGYKNNTQLTFLNEANVLENIKVRYYRAAHVLCVD